MHFATHKGDNVGSGPSPTVQPRFVPTSIAPGWGAANKLPRCIAPSASRRYAGDTQVETRNGADKDVVVNSDGIRMRTLERSLTPGKKPWWEEPRQDAAPVGGPRAKRSRNGSRGVDRNGSGTTKIKVGYAQSMPDGRSNGSGSYRSNGAAAAVDGPQVEGPQIYKEQLPVELAAELETDAGSQEYVMDSEFRWAQENYSSTRRSVEIWAFILWLRSSLYFVNQKWTYLGGFSEEKKSKRMRSLASWIRESILQLGPTFIKLGQLFSARSDLFSVEFTEELSKLQDRVPAFTTMRAINIIESELGAPIFVLFREFERRPIAAASLGQVHRAILHSGEKVVVKVQRPGLRKLFEIDLSNMQKLAAVLDKTDPARDFTGIYEECRTILYQEIDYINEGKNADRFRRNFRDMEWASVPRVSWEHTSPTVITLEYLPGMKISDVAGLKQSGLDLEQIARRSTEAYIIQVIRHGFLHSDPHAGNLAVSKTGQLIWYDFGMMSEIAPAAKDRLLDMFYAVYRQDADAVLGCLQDLGIIVATGDTLSLRRTISYFLENISQQAQRQETLNAIGEDLFSIAVDQPFRFPASFTFVLRAFSTLEGIGKLLVGPEKYSFATVAAPFAEELLSAQSTRGFALDTIGRQAVDLSVATAAMPERVAKIEGVTKALQQGSLKLRVRDPASERAARRASVMQSATFQAVGVAGLLDLGTQLQLAGQPGESYPFFGGAVLLLGLIFWGLRRVRRLDEFEKDLKSGPAFKQ